MKIVSNDLDKILDEKDYELDEQFDESNIEVHSCDVYPEEAEDYMKFIWADGEALTYDEYMDEFEAQED